MKLLANKDAEIERLQAEVAGWKRSSDAEAGVRIATIRATEYQAGFDAGCVEFARLTSELANKTDAYLRMWSALQAESAAHAEVRSELRAEIKRLLVTLTKIQQWDMLNPPATTMATLYSKSDFPWLKRLVDNALAGSVATPQQITQSLCSECRMPQSGQAGQPCINMEQGCPGVLLGSNKAN